MESRSENPNTASLHCISFLVRAAAIRDSRGCHAAAASAALLMRRARAAALARPPLTCAGPALMRRRASALGPPPAYARRLWVPRVASCAGPTSCAVGGAGRGARHWRWPAAAPGACGTAEPHVLMCRPWDLRSRPPAACASRTGLAALRGAVLAPRSGTSAGAPWPRVLLMRHCRSSRRRCVRPSRARLRRGVLRWCLLMLCKPTHVRH